MKKEEPNSIVSFALNSILLEIPGDNLSLAYTWILLKATRKVADVNQVLKCVIYVN